MHRITLVWKFSLSTADWTGFVPGFFYKTSEIQLEIIELCAFGPGKACGLHSLIMPIGWLWDRISFVLRRPTPRKFSPKSLSWTVKKTQITNCFMEIKSERVLLTSTITSGRCARWNWKISKCTWANSYNKMCISQIWVPYHSRCNNLMSAWVSL